MARQARYMKNVLYRVTALHSMCPERFNMWRVISELRACALERTCLYPDSGVLRFELTGTGGVLPYTWTASSLPPGLALSLEYGGKPFINGTPTPGSAQLTTRW